MAYCSQDVLVLAVARLCGARIATALHWLRWLRIYPASEAALGVVARHEDGDEAEDAEDQADQEPDAHVAAAPVSGKRPSGRQREARGRE